MPVEFVGANPCATLVRGSSRVGFVSLWEAEWSVHGSGLAVLAWVDGDDTVRLLTPDVTLGSWLATTFSRHFPEFEGLPDIGEPIECEVREWQIGPSSARANVIGADASHVIATMGRSVATRPAHVADWELGEVSWTLTNLLTYCGDATLEVDGARVLGRPVISGDGSRLTSTAFIATHETWTSPV